MQSAARADAGAARARGVGIPVYENDACGSRRTARPFWLAGLGDQWAFHGRYRRHPTSAGASHYEGMDDLPGTLAQMTDDAPVI